MILVMLITYLIGGIIAMILPFTVSDGSYRNAVNWIMWTYGAILIIGSIIGLIHYF